MTEAFKALSDPGRRKILRILGQGELTAGEIGSHFDFTAPTLSHHLAALKKAELIRVRRNGTQLIYCLNTTVMQDVAAAILDFLPTADLQREAEQP